MLFVEILKEIAPEKKQSVKVNSYTANTNISLPLIKERKPHSLSQKWIASLMNSYVLIYIYFIAGEAGGTREWICRGGNKGGLEEFVMSPSEKNTGTGGNNDTHQKAS